MITLIRMRMIGQHMEQELRVIGEDLQTKDQVIERILINRFLPKRWLRKTTLIIREIGTG
jgi:hypothetical protein